MRVVMNSLSLLLSMSHTKVSLVPDIFSSAVDRSWHFNKITPVEKMHKWGENGLFQEAITFSSEIGLRHEYSHWKYDSEENNLELL
jgi:hypothetical protein